MLQVKNINYSEDIDGNVILSLTVCKDFKQRSKEIYQKLKELFGKGKFASCELKEYRQKRSLDANAYAWLLINEIGNKTKLSKEQVYFQILKDYGQGGIIKLKENQVDLFCRSQKYYEEVTDNKFRSDGVKYYRFWLGSSLYDTKEMSILIDGIVSEAKELGIETLTPAELESLKGAWKS